MSDGRTKSGGPPSSDGSPRTADSSTGSSNPMAALEAVLRMDVKITSHLGLCASPDAPLGSLRPLMMVLELSCHGVPWILAAVVLFLVSHRAQDVEFALNLLFALFLDLIIVGSMKATFRRTRPSHNVMDMVAAPAVDKFSFPSGHTTRAAFMSLFLCKHALVSTVHQVCICLWAVCVAVSRVLLGRHHVLDVVCGFLVGVLTFYLYELLWIPEKTCLYYLDTYFGHVHL